MCHGADAKGTPGLAPNLTDSKWLDSDGTYASIVATIQRGVPDPKDGPSPMPPMGGANLTPAQVRAVAAYVYALTHPELRAAH
jgi:mono/diheme cytochrome c family protein